MRIIRARVSGFCMGVRRAVEMTYEAAKKNPADRSPAEGSSATDSCSPVYTYGPLIHNTRVLENLRGLGIDVLNKDEICSMPAGSTVIIRAHGIPPAEEKLLAAKNLKILDATCPHVKISQKKAMEYAQNGYNIFLAGEKDHAEIIGIFGYAEAAIKAGSQQSCFIVSSPAEAEATASKLAGRQSPGSSQNIKTVLIGQTTISPGEYKDIGDSIRRFFPGLEILQTICRATTDRQNSLAELCAQTNAVIIAGSKESANTRALLTLTMAFGKPCWLLDSPEDVPAEVFNYETIGLTAGASVPDELMDEIEEKIRNSEFGIQN
ncbi:MAG: 4-hydroxy-3-methylbut-2-enyl diphosphate reductase [Treponema sp.]|nr:4-hydroxy-3-methylbut-2-enyl diphosphate reductase [Treponema sp.]